MDPDDESDDSDVTEVTSDGSSEFSDDSDARAPRHAQFLLDESDVEVTPKEQKMQSPSPRPSRGSAVKRSRDSSGQVTERQRSAWVSQEDSSKTALTRGAPSA